MLKFIHFFVSTIFYIVISIFLANMLGILAFFVLDLFRVPFFIPDFMPKCFMIFACGLVSVIILAGIKDEIIIKLKYQKGKDKKYYNR